MPISDSNRRMLAALLARSRESNALKKPSEPTENWLKKPLPMEGRFGLLPVMESQPGMGPSVFNERKLALPGLLAGAVNAFTAPGRAVSGGLLNAKEEAANFAGTFMGGGLLGSRMAPAPRGSVGMNAYHGTPHKFDAFDLNKVGTGEGAQAFGHGLYFAESKAVAGQYQKQLSGDVFSVGDGTTFDPSALGHMSVRVAARKGDLGAAIARAKEIAASNSPSANIAASDLKALESIKARGGISPHKGHTYEVDIPDEAVGQMLDWDKPLSQQPKNVRDMLRGIVDGDPTGKQIYNQFAQDARDAAIARGERSNTTLGAMQRAASESLRDMGIPGIRYLDQASRSAGQGTRNLVVFDDKLARITKRE